MHITRVYNDPKAREKPCLRCGYSLRKLNDARHCPECGLSIWLSLNQNDSLDFSNPTWLGRLTLAMWVLIGAQIVGLTLWSAFNLLMYTSMDGVIWDGPLFAVILAVTGLYLAAYGCGMFLLSTDENRHPDKLKTYRWTLRIFGGITILVGTLVIFRSFTRIQVGWSLFLLGYVWQLAMAVVIFGSALATLAYLRKLALRMPSSRVAKLCGWMLLLPGFSFVAAVPCIGLWIFSQIFWLIYYLPWVYLPLSLGLFIWFALAFRRARISAVVNWAAETMK